ncbi:glutaredoxin family protein [Paenibacillus cellulosilyticus]|nr:glutaredoxin family protein [Paenibacillus cellulosilyticus]QKS45710.1 glutaredoxin family protein [Paenibacillus cellulosilyticus]
MSNKKLVLWNRAGCESCQQLKAQLANNGIDYVSIDVEGKNELRDVLEAKYGIRHVPVAEIGDGESYAAVTDGSFEKIQALLQA